MNKKIIILGSDNCHKCDILKNNINRVISNNNFDIKLEYITDIDVIIKYNIMSLPAIVINDNVISFGKVLNDNEILDIFNNYF